MSNQQIEVQIMGQSYLLGCPEGGQARLLAAVDKVDQAMCKVRDAGKIKARDRIAVLAALNLAFENVNTEEASQAAPSTANASSAPNPEAASASELQRLDQLLKRLDQALQQDGQLI
jgi:cell division protein ZapA